MLLRPLAWNRLFMNLNTEFLGGRESESIILPQVCPQTEANSNSVDQKAFIMGGQGQQQRLASPSAGKLKEK